MTSDTLSKMVRLTRSSAFDALDKTFGMALMLLATCFCVASMADGQDSFRAAVFEHVDPFNPSVSLEDVMLGSLDVFVEQAALSAALGVHILVFPEYGLSGVSVPGTRAGLRNYLQVLPSVEPGPTPWVPCLEVGNDFNVTILKRLSCAARDNAVVLVVNVGTVVECSNALDSACPPDGVYQFNTDVALGADGAVLATYHKMNLYHEPGFDRPPYPGDHVTTFTTAAATFGLITCFDLLYHDPLIALVEERGVRYVVMPTAWVDGLPFLTAVQSQMAWAAGLNVSVLAANLQNSPDGYRGSGIYHGAAGFLNYTYGPRNTSRLLWADVPLRSTDAMPQPPTPPRLFDYAGIIYDDLSNYTFAALDTAAGPGTATVRSGTLSCAAEYEFETAVDRGGYFLAAYDGFITLGQGAYRLAVQTCALVWCPDAADTDRCAQPPVTSTGRLVRLRLEGNFSTAYVYPSVLRADLQPVGAAEWHHATNVDADDDAVGDGPVASEDSCEPRRKNEDVNRVRLTTEPGFSHCPLVVALYGRLYDKDGE